MKKYGLIIIIIALVLVGAYFSFKRTNTNQNQMANTQPTFVPVATPTFVPSPLPSPSPVSTKSKSTKTNSGATSGQIACNYQVPAAPNQFGTVVIKSSWTNANMNLCVSINGGSPALISQDTKTSGERTDTPNWIALNTTYTFTMFNRLPGSAVCSGTPLSSCQIDTHFATITPKP